MQLRRADILNHIENLASVDMSKAMQQSSSQDFLTFTSTRARVQDGITVDLMDGKTEAAGASPVLHFTDIVRNALASDLARYGIELVHNSRHRTAPTPCAPASYISNSQPFYPCIACVLLL